MKIRNGFVSNSSSSSFVVAFPEMPTSVEHVREMMFGKELNIRSAYGDEIYTTHQIAETVYNDILNQKVNDKKNIIDGFNGWLEGSPEYNYEYNDELTEEEQEKKWNDYIRADRKFREDTAREFIESRKYKFIYVFEYGDENGDYGSTLEHGGIFDRLDYKKINRH